MSDDKTVTITIVAKNLTSEGFAAARRELGGLGTETDGVKAKFSGLTSGLKEFAGALGVSFSIGAVVAFTKHVMEAASRVGDLASKLDVTTEFVQRTTFAAEQAGATFEDVNVSLSFMNKTLAGGTDSTKEALAAAGLKFEAIRAMRPEDAFTAIAEGIQQIHDPMTQARVAVELFGRSGQNLLPAIKAGIKEVGDQTVTMSADVIARLKEGQDEWKRFGTTIDVVGAHVISTLGLGLKSWREWGTELLTLTPATTAQANATEALAHKTEDAARAAAFLAQVQDPLGQKAAVVKKITDEYTASLKTMGWTGASARTALQDLELALGAEHDVLVGLSPAVKQHIADLAAQGASVDDLVGAYKELGLTPTIISKIIEAQKQAAETAAQAAKKAAEITTRLSEEQWQDTLANQKREQALSDQEMAEFWKDLDAKREGEIKLAEDTWAEHLKEHAREEAQAQQEMDDFFRRLNQRQEADQAATMRLQILNATGHAKRILELRAEWDAETKRNQGLKDEGEGYTALDAKTDAYYRRLIQQEQSAKVLMRDLFDEVGRLGQGFTEAGRLFDSHLLTSLGRGIDKFQQMVRAINDITGAVRSISSTIAHFAGAGGGGGGFNIPGLGGGGGGGGNPISSIFGLGRSLFSGGGAAASMALPGAAAAATTEGAVALPSLGTTGAAGGAGGGLGAFLTNPWTIGIAAAGLGLFALGKHLWGDAGTDAKQDFGNKNYWAGEGKGLDAMHRLMIKKLGPRDAEELWQESGRIGKKDKRAAQAWEDRVIARFHDVGITGLRKFELGTGPRGVPYTMPAIVHQGETITPAGQSPGGTTINNFNFYGHDADNIARLMRGAGGKAFIDWIRNSGAARTALATAQGNG